jgi:hypothetical protein
MNLALEIQMDWKRKFGNFVINSYYLFSMILNEIMNLGASLPRTLKRRKPLIGAILRYMKSPTSKPSFLCLWST